MTQRIDLARDVHPLSAFRKCAAALIDRVQETRRPLVLTRNGRSAAVVLDAREFERMVERFELLEDGPKVWLFASPCHPERRSEGPDSKSLP